MMHPKILVLLFVANIATAQLQCHMPGECSGLYNGLTVEQSYDDCLNTCKSSPTCQWFTYFGDTSACFEYVDCLPLDTTCAECFSGQSECSPEGIVCGANGFCDGHVVAYETTSTASECLNLCQTYDECQWYSYYQGSQFCVLTEDCPFLDASCTDCLSGQRECYSDSSSLGKLFAVGGHDVGANYSAEVVDLVNNGLTCPDIADYPGATRGSVGTYIGNKVMVCGGLDDRVGLPADTCYNYNPSTDSWTQTVSMTEPRDMFTAVMMSETEWWISGGFVNDVVMSTEIYNSDTDSFVPYVSLPEGKSFHTMVKVDDNSFFLTGDGFGSNKTWMFDRESESWTPLPDMQNSRDSPFSGLLTYPDGRKEIVVAGDEYLQSSEILDLEQMTWRFGPDLPLALHGGVSVPYGNSFLVVGGFYAERAIYIFDLSSGEWRELSQTLAQGRDTFAGFLVPTDFVECV